jgi:hypothetical protein
VMVFILIQITSSMSSTIVTNSTKKHAPTTSNRTLLKSLELSAISMCLTGLRNSSIPSSICARALGCSATHQGRDATQGVGSNGGHTDD